MLFCRDIFRLLHTRRREVRRGGGNSRLGPSKSAYVVTVLEVACYLCVFLNIHMVKNMNRFPAKCLLGAFFSLFCFFYSSIRRQVPCDRPSCGKPFRTTSYRVFNCTLLPYRIPVWRSHRIVLHIFMYRVAQKSCILWWIFQQSGTIF